MKKKLISLLLVCIMAFALCVPAFAVDAGEERVVIGADLTSDQILTVYAQFGLVRGSVTELTVTNAEERSYLEGLISDSVIGTRSISCVYIKVLEEDAGLTVTTNNINWCTEDMYKSAMMTAGIYDAEVIVGAPYEVSGTAALTGIYKAYEDITGTELDEDAKSAAADELVVTAELAEEVDDADAVAIVNDLKLMLDETSDMTDEELQDQIEDIASDYGYTLDSELIDKLIELVRSMESLSIADLTDKVEEFRNTLDTVNQYLEEATTVGQKIVLFFQNIFQAIKNFFTGGNKDDDSGTTNEAEDVTTTDTSTDVSSDFIVDSSEGSEDTEDDTNIAGDDITEDTEEGSPSDASDVSEIIVEEDTTIVSDSDATD